MLACALAYSIVPLTIVALRSSILRHTSSGVTSNFGPPRKVLKMGPPSEDPTTGKFCYYGIMKMIFINAPFKVLK